MNIMANIPITPPTEIMGRYSRIFSHLLCVACRGFLKTIKLLKLYHDLVFGAGAAKLGVRSDGKYLAVVDEDDLVHLFDGGYSVSYEDGRLALAGVCQIFENNFFCLDVHRGYRVIENENRSVFHQRAGDRNTLLLSARNGDTALAESGCVALGKFGDIAVNIGKLCRFHDRVRITAVGGEGDVVFNSVAEKEVILRNVSGVSAHRVYGHIVDVNSVKEQRAVESFIEISLQTRQQIEEIESTSKYSENENAIISNSNFFIPTGDSFIVEPMSFIISNEGVLVSVRETESRTFRETEKRLQMNYRSYSTGYHIFISLLEVRIDFDADLVELVAKQVAALSKDINAEDSIDKEVLHRISALQENTMLLRENIFDRQRVLSGILRSERFPNDIYPRLQLMIKDVNSLINHADFSFQRLDYIQDATLGLINIEQNSIVKIFSVASVIFMPATLIASIYGMNFQVMPELSWQLTLANGWTIPMGYLFALGLMILCSAFTIWLFKYKKWQYQNLNF